MNAWAVACNWYQETPEVKEAFKRWVIDQTPECGVGRLEYKDFSIRLSAHHWASSVVTIEVWLSDLSRMVKVWALVKNGDLLPEFI